jgi:beta-lactamase superfamily II metal-dependent hydrolase
MGKLYHLNVGCADASIIVTDKATFLVDCHDIETHAHLLPYSKRLKAVFVTHQHYDHYSGLAYLRDKGYTVEYLITSPYPRRHGDASVTLDEWNEFNSHKDYFVRKGTKLYMPFRQAAWGKPWWTTNGVSFWMVGPDQAGATSATRELHDACLVVTAKLKTRTCCFTGDASDSNLGFIASHTNNYCNDILHASHHGSINGANLDFIKGCNAQYTVISTATGRYDNVPHPTALQRYKAHTAKEVYRTDKSKTLTWTF